MTKDIRALVIEVDATTRRVTLGDNTLQGFYRELHCRTVDVVRLSPSLDMWVDDEGAIVMDPEINHASTAIAHLHGHDGQPYFGPAIFTGGANDAGDSQSLSDDMADQLETWAEIVRAQLPVAEHVDQHDAQER
jgi:hypothetical protein